MSVYNYAPLPLNDPIEINLSEIEDQQGETRVCYILDNIKNLVERGFSGLREAWESFLEKRDVQYHVNCVLNDYEELPDDCFNKIESIFSTIPKNNREEAVKKVKLFASFDGRGFDPKWVSEIQIINTMAAIPESRQKDIEEIVRYAFHRPGVQTRQLIKLINEINLILNQVDRSHIWVFKEIMKKRCQYNDFSIEDTIDSFKKVVLFISHFKNKKKYYKLRMIVDFFSRNNNKNIENEISIELINGMFNIDLNRRKFAWEIIRHVFDKSTIGPMDLINEINSILTELDFFEFKKLKKNVRAEKFGSISTMKEMIDVLKNIAFFAREFDDAKLHQISEIIFRASSEGESEKIIALILDLYKNNEKNIFSNLIYAIYSSKNTLANICRIFRCFYPCCKESVIKKLLLLSATDKEIENIENIIAKIPLEKQKNVLENLNLILSSKIEEGRFCWSDLEKLLTDLADHEISSV